MFSIITTEPSTIRPKSIAPRLIRFPDTPHVHPHERSQHRERDDGRHDQRRADVAEKKKQHHRHQDRAPPTRFCATVLMVRLIRLARS